MDWSRTFIEIRDFIIPLLDIGILSFVFYKGYQILIQTKAVQLIRGTLMVFVIYGLALVLNLRTLLSILNLMAPGLIIAIAIIFQPELRKIFTRIGQGKLFSFRTENWTANISKVLEAAKALSANRRGMLVVFVRSVGLKTQQESGCTIDAEVSAQLLETIFAFDTPLHDGAVIIEKGRIQTAGVILPLSEQTNLATNFGTRHRAALGVVEDSDAVALVVSEETGALSLAYDSAILYDLGVEEIERTLRKILKLDRGAGVVKELEKDGPGDIDNA